MTSPLVSSKCLVLIYLPVVTMLAPATFLTSINVLSSTESFGGVFLTLKSHSLPNDLMQLEMSVKRLMLTY